MRVASAVSMAAMLLMFTPLTVEGQDARRVPIIRLLALPEGYIGVRVNTSGYLYQKPSGRWCIFVDDASAKAAAPDFAVCLELDDNVSDDDVRKSYGSQYVVVSGFFDEGNYISAAGWLSGAKIHAAYPLVRTFEDVGSKD